MQGADDHSEAEREQTRSLAEAASTARTLIGYSTEGAAQAMGISASILRDAESGAEPISPVLKLQLEACYEVKLEHFIKERPGYRPRTPLQYDEQNGVLRVGSLGVRFRKGIDGNDALLRGFSSAIRRQRKMPPSVPLRLRSADIPVLAELMDLSDPDLDARAQFWFGQTPETAQGFKSLLRTARKNLQRPAA
jgi:transcriptional regulator with XRE-family HTH domain